jgi:hypothetical protein
LLAVMALVEALPQTLPPWAAPEPVRPEAQETPAWVRTVLFGTAQQLASLPDTGLDPNTKNGNGTTLLMMAAPDAAKAPPLAGPRRSCQGQDRARPRCAYHNSSLSRYR